MQTGPYSHQQAYAQAHVMGQGQVQGQMHTFDADMAAVDGDADVAGGKVGGGVGLGGSFSVEHNDNSNNSSNNANANNDAEEEEDKTAHMDDFDKSVPFDTREVFEALKNWSAELKERDGLALMASVTLDNFKTAAMPREA